MPRWDLVANKTTGKFAAFDVNGKKLSAWYPDIETLRAIMRRKLNKANSK